MISLDIDEIILNHRKKNTISYSSVHNWLRKNFGMANRCENQQCNNPSKAFQWAKLRDKEYDYKRENFVMLCARCHYYYDEKYKRYKKLELRKNIFNMQLNLAF